MRDEQGFREFASARAGALRRQALLLTGEPARAAELAGRALADTARRWGRLADPAAADEHARTVLARSALRRGPRKPTGPPASAPTIAPTTTVPPTTAPPATVAAGALPAGRPAGRELASAGPAGGELGGGGTGDSEAVWRALGSLPPRRRAVLVLRYDERLDDAAVAARLGVAPAAVAAEGEAGLGALRSILRRRGRPEDLLPASLADPARDLPVPAGLTQAGAPARPHRRRRLLVLGSAAVIAVAAAVLVPMVRSQSAPAPATSSAREGQLGWPARGSLAGDRDLARSALRAWEDGVPAAQRPTESSVLYAGRPDGGRVVLLQGSDRAGLGWIAEIGDGGDTAPLRLRRTEPLGPATPVLALPAGVGEGDRVRLLGPPDRDGALLVRTGEGSLTDPLRRLQLDADGLSEPVDVVGGRLPVVVLRGGPDPGIVGSGQVTAGRLTAPGGEVEVGSSSLPGGGATDVRAAWYDDGRQLARRLGGPVTVAPAGPVLATSLGVRGRARRAEVRAYEVRHGGVSWFGTVVRVAGAPACVDAVQLGAVGSPPRLPVAVRRCLPAGARDGLVHVVAAPPATSVRVRLLPRRGQRERTVTVTPATAGARFGGGGFAALVRVGALPTGAGVVEARNAAGRPVSRSGLPPYAAHGR